MIAVALITRARILPTVSLGLVAAGAALASALMLSFSRGSLIALLVALAVLLVLERKRVAFGRLLAFTIAATGATVAVLYATVLAVFLASPLAGYISGAVIPVDGSLRKYQF